MIKFFSQKFNKKGFTLAELLVVIAIIAVLVAIAIPIFTGAVDKAQKARDDANIRSLKGAALVQLLTNESADITAKEWKVTGMFDKDGADLTSVEVKAKADGDQESNGTPGSIKYGEAVVIIVKGTDLK